MNYYVVLKNLGEAVFKKSWIQVLKLCSKQSVSSLSLFLYFTHSHTPPTFTSTHTHTYV